MSKTFWAVLQQREGKLHRSSIEAIAAAQQLAEAHGGGRVDAILLGGDNTSELIGEVASYELGAIYAVRDSALDHYTPGAYLGVLVEAVKAGKPDFVVLPHTYQTVDFAPRLAQQTDAAYLPELIGLEQEGGELLYRRPILTGKLQARVRVKGEGTVVVTVQTGAFSADTAKAGSAAEAALPDAGAPTPDRELLGVEQVGGDQVDLSKADVIVAVGRGIGKPENLPPIEELAKVLGADLGASRPVIDNGWLPRDRQIGSSGQTVAPKLYLALGVSGAIQHLVGMKGATCVVSINKDASAPIFNVSSYGIVGDLLEVVPALTEAVRAAKV
ncbi:MAG: electron transfer flavoprotein subunit alpha/FixB family protein [Acidobacteriota bacterium]